MILPSIGSSPTVQFSVSSMRLIACGPVDVAFTKENLQKTYGGRLTILDEAAEAMRQREPNR